MLWGPAGHATCHRVRVAPLRPRTSGRDTVRSGPPELLVLFQSAGQRTDYSHCHTHPWCLPICPVLPVRRQLLSNHRKPPVPRNFRRIPGGLLSSFVLPCSPCNGTGDSRRVLTSMMRYLGQSDGLRTGQESRMSAVPCCGSAWSEPQAVVRT